MPGQNTASLIPYSHVCLLVSGIPSGCDCAFNYRSRLVRHQTWMAALRSMVFEYFELILANWAGGIWVSFIAFWAISVYVAYKGSEAIKVMESFGAPILGILSLSLMIWAYMQVKSVGKALSIS